jgi:Uncharacterised nucleotidyltransferase
MKSETIIRDEELLLLKLCRLEFSDDEILKLRSQITAIADWDYFSSLANTHGIAALVYHNLEKHKFLTEIPATAVAFLKGSLMRSLSRNVFNTESIVEVLDLLNKNNIKTVLLKGLALELSVYGNAGLRQMSDVDVLIHKDQCMTARRILMNSGYISLPVKSIFHKLILADTGKHLPSLIKGGTSVEIHHELFGRKNKVLTRKLFDNSQMTELKGQKVYIPQPQLFFLYLIRHLSGHEMNNESQLRLYTDLFVLIGNYRDEIINPDLLTYASEADMDKTLASHLDPLREYWEVSFPGWLNEFIDKWHSPDSHRKFIFFLKSPKNNPPLNKPYVYRKIIKDIPGIHRKFAFLLGDIFPSLSFMKKRYKCISTWKVLFYYPHRIGKILWLFK